ncbi:MAG: SapC family protein, partial [Planctomycetales bacterium]|nr:SapC family protein [Planctomycetales bacterium]
MKQMLFYENVVPVSSQLHRDLCVERADFEFASHVNSVPLTAIEMPLAAREYTIVFAGNDEAVVPVVVLGVENSQNLYLDENKAWKADYIPAFVRRYPFVFNQNQDATQFTLCIDESWAGCNREGRGQRLFDENGEQTQYLKTMLKFLSDYQTQFVRTQAYCKKLKELNLLEPMQAQVVLPGGEKRSLGGFLGATRSRIKSLENAKLAELVKSADHRVRAAAIRTASHWRTRMKSPVVIEYFAAAVRDEHPRVRLEGVRALAEVPSAESAAQALVALDQPMDRFLDFALWQTMRDLQANWLPAVREGRLNFDGDVDRLTFALKAVDAPGVVPPLLALIRESKVTADRVPGILSVIAALGGANELGEVLNMVVDTGNQLSPEVKASLLDALVETTRLRQVTPA